MKGMNGSMSPALVNTSGSNTPRSPELDGVHTGATKKVQVNEELYPRSLPIRPVRDIEGEMGNWDGRREKNESENLPAENQDHQSSSAWRSRSAKDHMSMPTVVSNNNSGYDREDDRTPTSHGSFWGKE
jgi:hypothetical protein